MGLNVEKQEELAETMIFNFNLYLLPKSKAKKEEICKLSAGKFVQKKCFLYF